MHRSKLCSAILASLIHPLHGRVYKVMNIDAFYPPQQGRSLCVRRFGQNHVTPKRNSRLQKRRYEVLSCPQPSVVGGPS